MRLYVMRHGPAEVDSPSGRDFNRELSVSGRVAVVRVARALAARGEAILRVVSSPLVRAVQTAELVRSTLGVVAPVEVRSELAPSEDGVGLARELASEGSSALVVSHAPDVSALVSVLTERHAGGFDAGMVVALELEGARALRRFSIAPDSARSP